MDIFTHLKHEHDQIRDLLEQIGNIEDSPSEREELLSRLREELLTHAKGEEDTFYQELESRAGLRDLIHDAKSEHTAMEEQLDDLAALDLEDQDWTDQFEELRKTIESHFDEEENRIFERAKEALSEGDSERIFSRMRTAEEHYRASL